MVKSHRNYKQKLDAFNENQNRLFNQHSKLLDENNKNDETQSLGITSNDLMMIIYFN
jgi:hypothetical protein